MSAVPQVLELLNTYHGSVKKVATEINLSPSYVSRVKSELWKPQSIQQNDIEDVSSPIVPPNLEAIANLRDALLNSLIEKADLLPAGEQRRILEVVLDFEVRHLGAVQAPKFNVYNDNRQQNIAILAEKLSKVASPKQLMELAGQDYEVKYDNS